MTLWQHKPWVAHPWTCFKWEKNKLICTEFLLYAAKVNSVVYILLCILLFFMPWAWHRRRTVLSGGCPGKFSSPAKRKQFPGWLLQTFAALFPPWSPALLLSLSPCYLSKGSNQVSPAFSKDTRGNISSSIRSCLRGWSGPETTLAFFPSPFAPTSLGVHSTHGTPVLLPARPIN